MRRECVCVVNVVGGGADVFPFESSPSPEWTVE